jgi:hypothetical protein
MPVDYSGYHDRQLNEIIMAGSHDGGINRGLWFAKTQYVGLAGQATAGVRVFDLRVAAQNVTLAGPGQPAQELVKYRTFHSEKRLMKTKTTARAATDNVADQYGASAPTREATTIFGGAYGQGLTKLLRQARAFVTTNAAEFLILKFDKSQNSAEVAQVCVNVLGPTLYNQHGNLNTTLVGQIAGKVVVVFTPDALQPVPAQLRQAGILGINNLYEKNGHHGQYNRNYDGIQYFGKGGVTAGNPFFKVANNEALQKDLMANGLKHTTSQVMGMMYWTTTGKIGSIHWRNHKLWTDDKQARLKSLWEGGLDEAIKARMARHIRLKNISAAGLLKTFLPNIVMIDFADATRCQTIFDLNKVAATVLREIAEDFQNNQ